jgi:hypothetical protein
MRKIVMILVLLVAAAAGALWLAKTQGDKSQQDLAGKLQSDIQEKDREVSQLREARERAERQLRELAMASDEMMAQARAREAALKDASEAQPMQVGAGENDSESKAGLGKFFSNMMKDPEMKKMIMDQQRNMLGQMYGPLIQKLQLSPEEAQAFKDLLLENMGNATELASTMFESGNAGDRKEISQKLAAQTQLMEDAMKDLLGEERYAHYKEYQKTVGERAQLTAFRQETMGMGEPISESQTEQLIKIMGEERSHATATAGIEFPDGTKGQFPGAMNEEQIEKLLGMQEQINRNVYQRAEEVLSASQLDAFGKHQSTQYQMMRMGLNMARKFMGPGND